MSSWPYNTGQWQRLRIAKLVETPLCEVCIRREVVEVATVVDHVLAIAKGGEPFPALHELMSMCAPCHNIKTRAMDSADSTGFRRAFKGCDVDGNPIDPDGWEHPPTARPVAPGATSSRERPNRGPPAPPRTDLVLQLVPDEEASTWV